LAGAKLGEKLSTGQAQDVILQQALLPAIKEIGPALRIVLFKGI